MQKHHPQYHTHGAILVDSTWTGFISCISMHFLPSVEGGGWQLEGNLMCCSTHPDVL